MKRTGTSAMFGKTSRGKLSTMGRWRVAGLMVAALREAESRAEQRRILEEQRQESIKNGNILRKLARHRARIDRSSKMPFIKDEQMMTELSAEKTVQEWDVHAVHSDRLRREDERDQQVLLENMRYKDAAVDEARKVRDQINDVRLKEKEVDREILETQLKLKAFNRQLANVHVVSPDKVVRRQEVTNQAYGRQLEENRQLKEQISHLEGERDKVAHILQDLQKDCDQLSKELGECSEEVKTTYETRDMKQMKMDWLKDHLDKRTSVVHLNMQLMQSKMDVLKRLEKFITTKNKFRANEGIQWRRDHRSQLSVTEKDSIHFGALLDKIRTELKQEDVHVIISTFGQLEQENYMLLRTVSEKREACHRMKGEISQVKAQIDSLRHARRQTLQEASSRRLELEEKVEISKKEADKQEEELRKADEEIQTYIQDVVTTLSKLGYTEQHLQQLSGQPGYVEERNIHKFLAILEDYVDKLFQLKITSDFLANDRARQSAQGKCPVEPLPPRLALQQRGMVVVVPPQHKEDEDVDDPTLPAEASFRLLSVSEIRRHVDKGLEPQRKLRSSLPGSPTTRADATPQTAGTGDGF